MKQERVESSREKLIRAAEKLFAEHGIAGVGVRTIVKAAGHKNANSLHYHFGSKANLVHEILRVGAEKADACRKEKLAILRAREQPATVRDVIMVLLAPTIERAVSPSFTRLVNVILMEPESVHSRVLSWPRGRDAELHIGDGLHTVDQCEEMILRMIKHVPKSLLRERLFLFHTYMLGFLVVRDDRIRSGEGQDVWASRRIVEHFIDTAEALLCAEESEATRVLVKRRRRQSANGAKKGLVKPEAVAFRLFD